MNYLSKEFSQIDTTKWNDIAAHGNFGRKSVEWKSRSWIQILKTFSMYRLSEIWRSWWFNFFSVSWFCTPRTGVPIHAPCLVSRTDLSMLGNRLSSLCHTRELDDEFSTLSRADFSAFERSEFQPNLAILWAAWCTRIQRGRLIRVQTFWYQTCRLPFRYRRSFFDPSFLSSLRHDALLSVRRKMTAGKNREIHDVDQTEKMTHSSRVKLSLINMSASWFFRVIFFIWILDVQIDSIKQPIQRNSVGSGHVSDGRTSVLLWSFWSQLCCLQKCTTELRIEKVLRFSQRDPL